METTEILEGYKKLLQSPIKVNFMGKKKDSSLDKEQLISTYYNIAKHYIDIVRETDQIKQPDTKIICSNEECSKKKHIDIVDNNYVCTSCGNDVGNSIKFFKL